MLFAAKSLALSAARLMDEPETLARVQREFRARTKEHPFVCPIPADIRPKY